MKLYRYILILLISTGLYAQKAQVDKIEETTVRTVKFEKDNETLENKVRVKTQKEQLVLTDSSFDTSPNADRVFPKVKVTKTIGIDNDNDPFYDSEAKFQYYILNDDTYKFESKNNGFIIFKNKIDPIAMATRTNSGKFYLLNMDKYAGVGYFDEESNFVIEYLNAETGLNITEKFEVESDF